VEWRIEAATPISGLAGISVVASEVVPVRGEARLSFTPKPEVPQASYVPEPKSVRGPFEVGAYYFPGWKSRSQCCEVFLISQ
jgi:hypothetical protein